MKMINQKSWYNRSLIEQQIGISNLQEREQLLKEKKKGTATTMPLLLKYDRTFLNIKEIVMKHWHLLHINPNLTQIFQNPPILAFCRNKNFRDIIGNKLLKTAKSKGNLRSKYKVNVHYA